MSASGILSSSLLALLATSASPSHADDRNADSQLVMIPNQCLQYRSPPASEPEEAVWDRMISFASCIQDASIYSVTRAAMVPALVEKMEEAIMPSFQFYVGVLEHAPEHIKVRAAYALALGEVALITRARMSVQAPRLRKELEPLLDPHAQLAYVIFSAIDQVAREDPSAATDPVNRAIVRSSRQQAAALRTRWPEETAQELTALASP